MGWTVYTSFKIPGVVDDRNLKKASAMLNKASTSAKTVAVAFKELARVAAKIPFPDFAEIRKMRLQRMKVDYGYLRFLSPEYYRWLMFR